MKMAVFLSLFPVLLCFQKKISLVLDVLLHLSQLSAGRKLSYLLFGKMKFLSASLRLIFLSFVVCLTVLWLWTLSAASIFIQVTWIINGCNLFFDFSPLNLVTCSVLFLLISCLQIKVGYKRSWNNAMKVQFKVRFSIWCFAAPLLFLLLHV